MVTGELGDRLGLPGSGSVGRLLEAHGFVARCLVHLGGFCW